MTHLHFEMEGEAGGVAVVEVEIHCRCDDTIMQVRFLHAGDTRAVHLPTVAEK